MAASPSSPLRAWWHRYVMAFGLVMVLITTGIVGANVVTDQKFAAIHRVKNLRLSDQGHPARAGNYLIIGSDTRAFVDNAQQAEQFGTASQEGGQRSDTMMIVHVEPKSKQSLLVSIPRDLWVKIPGHGYSKINAAFNYGSTPEQHVQSVIDTILANFDVGIDHYLQVDFATFQGIVDAIGHVAVYFPSRARDTFTGLNVTNAGCYSMDGAQALAYVRSRHMQYFVDGRWQDADGMGDIGRINRQQNFIRHLADVAVRAGLRNPITANAIADKVVAKLTIDEQMSKGDIFGLMNAFRKVDPNDPNTLQMVTLPWKTGPNQGGQSVLYLKQPDADQVLARLREFGPIAAADVGNVKPAEVKVRVLNGTGINGQAGAASRALVDAGFVPAGTGNGQHASSTTVRYLPNAHDKAALVQRYLGGVGRLVADSSIVDADVVVLLGGDFQHVVAPGAAGSAGSAATTPTTRGHTTATSAAKSAAPAC
ncbi:MAG TPA: LCP family protein [Acidimicrobiia bacterium]|nr:LCP family protein [Acidimicrobiia bacterium]